MLFLLLKRWRWTVRRSHRSTAKPFVYFLSPRNRGLSTRQWVITRSAIDSAHLSQPPPPRQLYDARTPSELIAGRQTKRCSSRWRSSSGSHSPSSYPRNASARYSTTWRGRLDVKWPICWRQEMPEIATSQSRLSSASIAGKSFSDPIAFDIS